MKMIHRKQIISRWWQYLRLRLAIKIFPGSGLGVCANRVTHRFTTPRLEAALVIRDRTKEDGYSWEEALKFLDTFVGRALTQEEWRQILQWKGVSPEQRF